LFIGWYIRILYQGILGTLRPASKDQMQITPLTVNFNDMTPDNLYRNWGPQTEQSAGLDLMTTEDLCIHGGDVVMVKTGIQISIPEGYVGILSARSSTFSKFGLMLTNGVGVIDSDYRGELLASFINTKEKHWRADVPRGTRLAQLLILPRLHASPVNVGQNIDKTKRGSGGFGSTG